MCYLIYFMTYPEIKTNHKEVANIKKLLARKNMS